jgi:hypothetical protein
VTQRWQDLLACEHAALETLRAAGISATTAQCFDVGGVQFLEVERFDRVGLHGRRGLISLFALANEYLGHLGGWTRAALDLREMERIGVQDARTMRWLDAFGQLIGNTDRHFGNLSFHAADSGALRLAPVYDMLPMLLAPQGTSIVPRRFEPQPPTADNFDVWSDAARAALASWDRLAACTADLSGELREICSGYRDAVKALVARVPGN